MASFDSNTWYLLQTLPQYNNKSWASSNTLDYSDYLSYNCSNYANCTAANAYGKPTNISDIAEQWQLFPSNDTGYFYLRTRQLGPSVYMQPFYYRNLSLFVPEQLGDTAIIMSTQNSGGGAEWRATPWGDGTWNLTNKANGSDWVLDVREPTGYMNTNVTQPRLGQHWQLASIGLINDDRFSATPTPYFTAPVTATATSTPTGGSTGASSTSPSSGSAMTSSTPSSLSSGVIAGIVIGVVCAVALLAGLTWFLLRQNRRRHLQNSHDGSRSSDNMPKDTYAYITRDPRGYIPEMADARTLSEPSEYSIPEMDGGWRGEQLDSGRKVASLTKE